MTLAIPVGTVESLFSAAVKLVDLTLVSQKTARIRETLQLLTSWTKALVRTFVLIHMLAVKMLAACTRR